MSPQQHEAVMQAEDPSEPPANGGNSTSSQTSRLQTRFYSIAEVAGMISLSQDTVRREICSGGLTAYKFRGRWRIKDQDFEAWANRSRYRPADGVKITYELASVDEDYRW